MQKRRKEISGAFLSAMKSVRNVFTSNMNNSIFIEHNKPSFFSEPMLVDKGDPEFFEKFENQLEDERRRTLKIITLALGIHNYHIVN